MCDDWAVLVAFDNRVCVRSSEPYDLISVKFLLMDVHDSPNELTLALRGCPEARRGHGAASVRMRMPL
jgi:hypothetical protein